MSGRRAGVGAGVGALLRGFGLIATQPRLFALGMVPPLVTSALLVAAWIVLLVNADSLAAAVLGLLPGAPTGGAARVLVAIALGTGGLLVSVLVFSALTLTLGAPVYDAISAGVDRHLGGLPPEPREGAAAMVLRVLGQAVGTVALSLVGALVCFLLGLVPVAGAVLGVVASTLFGGWMVCRELIVSTCERRGVMTFAERRGVMLRSLPGALGFGVPAYWLLSIPLLGVVVFPAAVAGGTVLAREMLATTVRYRRV